MMFQVDYFDKLVKLVEDYHGKPFYEMWIKCINERSLHHAGAADYEIYYNFMMDQYRDKIIERKLAFTNVPNIQFDPNDYQNCDFVSCHHYCRRK